MGACLPAHDGGVSADAARQARAHASCHQATPPSRFRSRWQHEIDWAPTFFPQTSTGVSSNVYRGQVCLVVVPCADTCMAGWPLITPCTCSEQPVTASLACPGGRQSIQCSNTWQFDGPGSIGAGRAGAEYLTRGGTSHMETIPASCVRSSLPAGCVCCRLEPAQHRCLRYMGSWGLRSGLAHPGCKPGSWEWGLSLPVPVKHSVGLGVTKPRYQPSNWPTGRRARLGLGGHQPQSGRCCGWWQRFWQPCWPLAGHACRARNSRTLSSA